MRRCAGCGRRAPKAELVRLAPSGGGLVVDHDQQQPGRGTYVCSEACLGRATRRGALRGTLDRPVSNDAQTVESVG